jgi:hypothetical protein
MEIRWVARAMLIGVLVIGCGCGEEPVVENYLSMFYLANASSDTIVVAVQEHERDLDSTLWIPPALSRLIDLRSSTHQGFPRPEDALACVSVYTVDGERLIYQHYPVSNASWSEGEGAQYTAYELTVTDDSLDLSGIPDGCGR